MNESGLSQRDYLRFQALVQERSGLHFAERRALDLASGVMRGMAEVGQTSLDEYYLLVSDTGTPAGRAACEQLVNLLTVGETHFFRDESQFAALEQHVLPALISRNVAAGTRRLRVWSAGCASGEEPYSLAILLTTLLDDIDDWDITLLATDINSAVLRRAQEAVYGEWSFREERAHLLRGTYFVKGPGPRAGVGPRYTLRENIRRRVSFAPLNLAEDAYPALYNNTVAMDLILCRNVMIYFQDATTRRVLSRLSDCLVDDGWLVLGHADPAPNALHPQLQVRVIGGAVVYQKGVTPAIPPGAAVFGEPLTGVPVETPVYVPAEPAWPFPPPEVPPAVPPAAPPVAPSAAPQPDLPAEVMALLANGQAVQAVERLEAYLARRPDDATALRQLGEAYANLARWRRARDACERAIERDPLQQEAHFVLGMVREHSGDLSGALESFKRVVYLDRGHVLAHMALAGLHQRAGRVDAAARSLRNVVRLLEALLPSTIIPGSGGTTAARLLIVARELLRPLQEQEESTR